jgi:hypothetical protein
MFIANMIGKVYSTPRGSYVNIPDVFYKYETHSGSLCYSAKKLGGRIEILVWIGFESRRDFMFIGNMIDKVYSTLRGSYVSIPDVFYKYETHSGSLRYSAKKLGERMEILVWIGFKSRRD